MKFAPKTEKEIMEANLVPAGTYDFEIFRAEEKKSKSGNDMIELGLKIFKPDGLFVMINDYLLESLEAKLRGAADACQLLHKYDLGELHAQDFVYKCGKVKIVIQKDETGKWADKNSVQSYVKKGAAMEATKAAPKIDEELNDDIPF